MPIEKTSILGDVLEKYPETARIFMEFGMFCLGCPHAMAETIEMASQEHEINTDELVHQLNEYVSGIDIENKT